MEENNKNNKDSSAKYIYYAFLGVGFIAVLALVFLFSIDTSSRGITENNTENLINSTQKTENNQQYENLAKCLTAKGAVLYGAYWCPHCRNQKELFGDAVKDIKYVECQAPNGGQTPECEKAGITAYPTWIINGKQYVGEKSLQELAGITGCGI